MKYSTRTTENAATVSPVLPWMFFDTRVRSTSPTRDTMAVPFISSMSRLPNGGSISANACGSSTRRIRWNGVKFSAIVASNCAFGTALIEPRTTSAP